MTYYEGKQYCCPFNFDYPEHGCECEKEHKELYEKFKDDETLELYFHEAGVCMTLQDFFDEYDPAYFGNWGEKEGFNILTDCDFKLYENKGGSIEGHLAPPLKMGDIEEWQGRCCCSRCRDIRRCIKEKIKHEKKYDAEKEEEVVVVKKKKIIKRKSSDTCKKCVIKKLDEESSYTINCEECKMKFFGIKYDEKKEDNKRFDEWRKKTHPHEEAFWYEENEECPNPDPWQKSSYNSFEEAIVGEYGDKSEQAKQYSVGMFAPK